MIRANYDDVCAALRSAGYDASGTSAVSIVVEDEEGAS